MTLEQQSSLNSIVPEPIAPQNDSLANYEKAALENDGHRKEGFKSHLHRIIIIFLYFAAFLVACLFAIRFWHFAAPERLCWLDKDQIHDIERVIFSSAFLTAISFYFKTVIKLK